MLRVLLVFLSLCGLAVGQQWMQGPYGNDVFNINATYLSNVTIICEDSSTPADFKFNYWVIPDMTVMKENDYKETRSLDGMTGWAVNHNGSEMTLVLIYPHHFGFYYCNGEDAGGKHYVYKRAVNYHGPHFENLWEVYQTQVIVGCSAAGGVLLICIVLFLIFKFRYMTPEEREARRLLEETDKLQQMEGGENADNIATAAADEMHAYESAASETKPLTGTCTYTPLRSDDQQGGLDNKGFEGDAEVTANTIVTTAVVTAVAAEALTGDDPTYSTIDPNSRPTSVAVTSVGTDKGDRKSEVSPHAVTTFFNGSAAGPNTTPPSVPDKNVELRDEIRMSKELRASLRLDDPVVDAALEKKDDSKPTGKTSVIMDDKSQLEDDKTSPEQERKADDVAVTVAVTAAAAAAVTAASVDKVKNDEAEAKDRKTNTVETTVIVAAAAAEVDADEKVADADRKPDDVAVTVAVIATAAVTPVVVDSVSKTAEDEVKSESDDKSDKSKPTAAETKAVKSISDSITSQELDVVVAPAQSSKVKAETTTAL